MEDFNAVDRASHNKIECVEPRAAVESVTNDSVEITIAVTADFTTGKKSVSVDNSNCAPDTTITTKIIKQKQVIRQLSNDERRAVFTSLSSRYHEGVLERGALSQVAHTLHVDRSTVHRIWTLALSHMVDGTLPDVALLDSKRHVRNADKSLKYDMEDIAQQVLHYSEQGITSYRALSWVIQVPKSTLKDYVRKKSEQQRVEFQKRKEQQQQYQESHVVEEVTPVVVDPVPQEWTLPVLELAAEQRKTAQKRKKEPTKGNRKAKPSIPKGRPAKRVRRTKV
jgi:hypothetical protein